MKHYDKSYYNYSSKKDGKVAVAGDGQVTFGEVVFKGNAKNT